MGHPITYRPTISGDEVPDSSEEIRNAVVTEGETEEGEEDIRETTHINQPDFFFFVK
jgi:hypothetical protein